MECKKDNVTDRGYQGGNSSLQGQWSMENGKERNRILTTVGGARKSLISVRGRND